MTEPVQQNGVPRDDRAGRVYGAAAMLLVVGVFLLAVIYLLWTHGRSTEAILDEARLEQLQEQAVLRPNDAALKEEIRQLDQRLRREFFLRRTFVDHGRYVLLAGAVVFLVVMKLLLGWLRQALARPEPTCPGRTLAADHVERIALIITIVGLLGGVLWWGLSTERLSWRDIAPAAIDGKTSTAATVDTTPYWPMFRGPGGVGLAEGCRPPLRWDEEAGESILWKIPVPLPGFGSPVVVGTRIFISGADEQRQEIYCFDADSGALQWREQIGIAADTEPPEVWDDTGLAAPTPAANEQCVCVIFATGDLGCFALDGRLQWTRRLGPLDSMYGYASSLVILRDTLIVLLDQGYADDELSEVMALNLADGTTRWRTPRPVGGSWASPIVADFPNGSQLLTCGDPWLIAYNPDDGKELWRAECLGSDVAPTPVVAEGLVLVAAPNADITAVRSDGSGDVTETHIAWTAMDGVPDITSPVTDGNLLFLLTTYGDLTCYSARSGRMLWQEMIDGEFRASPAIADGRIYLFSEEGRSYVCAVGESYELLAQGTLSEGVSASPAFVGERIYVRGREHLYCIGAE